VFFVETQVIFIFWFFFIFKTESRFDFLNLFCINADHLDERGRLQKGKIVGIGESHVTVGWIDTDNRHKIKSLDRPEIMLVKQPFLRRLPEMCSWNAIFLMFFTFMFYLLLFVNVFCFSFTQVTFIN